MKARKVKQQSQETAWDYGYVSISWGLLEGHPSLSMWPLSLTPNLLSKCHQPLAKDKSKVRCESLCIHLPLSVPWIGLLWSNYTCLFVAMQKRRDEKRSGWRRRGIISFLTMQEGLWLPSKSADACVNKRICTHAHNHRRGPDALC